MSLSLVATPIGDPQDITVRALELLRRVEIIILEERKEGTAFLRQHQITGKKYFQLNEHSNEQDLNELVELCRSNEVALITDCGTPGFCDPGADLVRLCRQQGIAVHTLPGASSLMCLLSLSGQRINQFLFRGFVSADSEQREKDWKQLVNERRPFVMMDTPYRLEKTLSELRKYFPDRKVLLACNVTSPEELIIEGLGKDMLSEKFPKKAEFLVLVYGI
jgi:16S rRNA (cytidine1402-2'-O)-methyltransferase